MDHRASSSRTRDAANRAEHNEGREKTFTHPDGTHRSFVEEGADERGAYLLVRSVVPPTGALLGPHWHLLVEQTFGVEEGTVRFWVDRREMVLGSAKASPSVRGKFTSSTTPAKVRSSSSKRSGLWDGTGRCSSSCTAWTLRAS